MDLMFLVRLDTGNTKMAHNRHATRALQAYILLPKRAFASVFMGAASRPIFEKMGEVYHFASECKSVLPKQSYISKQSGAWLETTLS